MRETCCITLCQLFLKKDESLQKKAAGFISKYGDASSSVLQETLQAYQPEMFQSVQTTIATFNAQSIGKTNNTETAYIEAVNTETTTTAADFLSEEPSTETIRICREDNRIPYPANKEDFLFQLSRLFDMEERRTPRLRPSSLSIPNWTKKISVGWSPYSNGQRTS